MLLDDLLRVWSGPPMMESGDHDPMMMMGYAHGAWTAGYFMMMLVMWQIMMVAMMVPTTIPMITTFSDIQSAAAEKGEQTTSSWIFSLAYFAVWSLAALVLVTAQWLMTLAFGSVEVLIEHAPMIAGTVMIVAGLYQWTTIKDVCLVHCQSPMQFILSHWREGRAGAVCMGVHHGLFCLGCCWAYMLLMFVAGTMNLVWMLSITAVMVLEKIVPGGNLFSWVVGTGLMVGGAAVIVQQLM